mmetsp:Transcript_91816/g.168360  ORF Transcript_91816/g.168360 Transcript_91816/m.168360 type:complete len:93 (-) Transcript_91816:232-510(-)
MPWVVLLVKPVLASVQSPPHELAGIVDISDGLGAKVGELDEAGDDGFEDAAESIDTFLLLGRRPPPLSSSSRIWMTSRCSMASCCSSVKSFL